MDIIVGYLLQIEHTAECLISTMLMSNYVMQRSGRTLAYRRFIKYTTFMHSLNNLNSNFTRIILHMPHLLPIGLIKSGFAKECYRCRCEDFSNSIAASVFLHRRVKLRKIFAISK